MDEKPRAVKLTVAKPKAVKRVPVKRITAETLIELAAAAVRTELAPSLPPEQKYLAAMVASALDIARREITGRRRHAAVGRCSTASTRTAKARRSSSPPISGPARSARPPIPASAGKLLEVLETELRLRNPKALPARPG